jgi:ATP-dependent helicase HrpB
LKGPPVSLPIDAIRTKAKAALSLGRPLIITAPTGSGKSTQLPLWLAEDLNGPVLVVEPRRVACRSLATWVAQLKGTNLGDGVGYRIRYENKSSKNTQILFVTPGVALRMLRQGPLTPWAAVVLDEFHERSWQVDLLLTLLQWHRQKGAYRGALIVASATLDAQSLEQSLQGTHLEAQGRTFPVSVEHLPEPAAPSGRDLEERVARVVEAALRDPEGGDILVFLPGKSEIEKARTALSAHHKPGKVTVLGVHAGLPGREMARVFSDTFDGRRVYLSTNVAETSITLPGVRTVVDSGLERRKVHHAGRSVLMLQPVATSSLEQRAGRAGRVAAGHCVRLFARSFQAAPAPTPEVGRIELDDVVLQAAACGLGSSSLAAAPWPTPPPSFALNRAIERLSSRGALAKDGSMTPRGRALADLPLSASEARVLLEPPLALAGVLADLAALMDQNRDFLLPLHTFSGERRRDVEEARKEFLGQARHEVEAALLCLRRGEERKHGIHGASLAESRRLSSSLRHWLECKTTDPTHEGDSRVDWQAVSAHLLERLPDAGFVLRPRALKEQKERDGDPWANGKEEIQVKRWQAPGLDPDRPLDKPRAALVLSHTWVTGKGGRGARGWGRLLLPCTPALLAESGIGEIRDQAPSLSGRGEGLCVRVQRETTLAEVVLKREAIEAVGEPLRHALAQLIADNRWMKGAAMRLANTLHLWRLIHQWPEDANLPRLAEGLPPPTDLRSHLIERLEKLGVQEGGDLVLLEEADLNVDLAQLFGMNPDEVERLARDFPRRWSYQGGTHEVQVNPKAKRVTLVPVDKKAKKAKEPDAKLLPRFRGFQVRYQQASRTLTLR